MLEGDAAIGEILSETAPGSEIEFVGPFQLRQVVLESGALGQKAEDTALVEHVDLVSPDHVVDGRKFSTISDQ
jgi:hypothetical protein